MVDKKTLNIGIVLDDIERLVVKLEILLSKYKKYPLSKQVRLNIVKAETNLSLIIKAIKKATNNGDLVLVLQNVETIGKWIHKVGTIDQELKKEFDEEPVTSKLKFTKLELNRAATYQDIRDLYIELAKKTAKLTQLIR